MSRETYIKVAMRGFTVRLANLSSPRLSLLTDAVRTAAEKYSRLRKRHTFSK